MDQRNAGRSRGPVSASDGWRTYASDHLALLDHLGIARCHLLGACIGGAFGLALATAAPERVTAAVLQQPIGLSGDNRSAFQKMFDGWAEEPCARGATSRPRRSRDCGPTSTTASSRSARRATSFARAGCRSSCCAATISTTPSVTSEEIVQIAPRAELVTSWKEGDDLVRAVARVRAFFALHAPR
jgi:pimeloyl-ACP methyl ester carboxylesterase